MDNKTQELMGVANSLRKGAYQNAIGVELKDFSPGFQLLYCYIGDQFLPRCQDARQLAGEAMARRLNQPCPQNKNQPIFSFRVQFGKHLSVMLYSHQADSELLCKLQSLRQSFRDHTQLANLQLFLIDGDVAYRVPEPQTETTSGA